MQGRKKILLDVGGGGGATLWWPSLHVPVSTQARGVWGHAPQDIFAIVWSEINSGAFLENVPITGCVVFP